MCTHVGYARHSLRGRTPLATGQRLSVKVFRRWRRSKHHCAVYSATTHRCQMHGDLIADTPNRQFHTVIYVVELFSYRAVVPSAIYQCFGELPLFRCRPRALCSCTAYTSMPRYLAHRRSSAITQAFTIESQTGFTLKPAEACTLKPMLMAMTSPEVFGRRVNGTGSPEIAVIVFSESSIRTATHDGEQQQSQADRIAHLTGSYPR